MPSRLLFDLGGTVNAQGNATIAGGAGQQQPASSPSQGTITATLAAGTGTWVVEITRGQGATGTLIGTGQGASIQQSFILLPGEMVQASVSGATAGTGIIGSVMGTSGLPPMGLPPMYASGLTTDQVNATISGPVGVTGTVGTTDAGLAGSIAQKLSQFVPLTTANLTSGATTTISIGDNTGNPYPQNAASWQLVVTGLGGVNFGCRVSWDKQDGSGNDLGYTQRDSAQITMDKIIASGILDAPTMIFSITLPAGAPNGCIAYLYSTALLIQDNWYDSGIYENTSSQAGLFQPGYDGILATVSNVIGAGSSQTYQLPTYRGPVQFGIQLTQAGHCIVQEFTYLAAGVSANMNIPVSSSGLSQQIFTLFLAGMNNKIVVFNDDGGATNTVNMEMRAVKDLLD